jgi:hypothetical protein
MTEELSKVDSAVGGLAGSPPKDKANRRASSVAAGIMNINDLGTHFRSYYKFWTAPVSANTGGTRREGGR